MTFLYHTYSESCVIAPRFLNEILWNISHICPIFYCKLCNLGIYERWHFCKFIRMRNNVLWGLSWKEWTRSSSGICLIFLLHVGSYFSSTSPLLTCSTALEGAPIWEKEVQRNKRYLEHRINRCVARYSPHATTTKQPTNRPPNEPARPKCEAKALVPT